ncbi:uncharacterized protein SCHCODRAFT_02521052, partial [Schizophyllum commune H4-8]
AEQRRRRSLHLLPHFQGHLRVRSSQEKYVSPPQMAGTSLSQTAIAWRESATVIIFSPESTP